MEKIPVPNSGISVTMGTANITQEISESNLNWRKYFEIPEKTKEVIFSTFQNTEFDVVFSHSVFHYFPNLDYAENVLATWCKRIKSGGKLVLMDLNNKSTEQNYHAERMLAYKNPAQYYQSYEGLNHLFFDKAAISQSLLSLGMTNVNFFSHAVENYGNAKFRFNLICDKL